MNKVILSTVIVMLMGSNAIAETNIIAPPILKYQENVPLPPRYPENFGRINAKKVTEKTQEIIFKRK